MIADTDLTIIGAGPIGLFAAFYAGLRELDVTVIESLESVGGQVANLYPQKAILDVAGFINVSGRELIQSLTEQMTQLPQKIHTDTTVMDVQADKIGFQIVTTNGDFHTKAVLVATGRGAFEPRRLPEKVENNLMGVGVYYFLNDLEKFRGKRILVAGGGDSAVDMATLLATVADHVYLTHRREKFRAMEHAVSLLDQSEVEQVTPYELDLISKNDDGSLRVDLTKSRSDETLALIVDAVMVNYGFMSENKIVSSWQAQPIMERQRFVVNQELATSVPGIYAVGDVAGYSGKAELIATGFGEVPTAINSIIRQIAPEKQGPVHSSGIRIENGAIQS